MAGTRGAIRGVARQHQAESLTIDFVHFVRNVVRAVLDPYRPELHYMRGPGPKWHAKHHPAPVSYHAMPALIRVKAR